MLRLPLICLLIFFLTLPLLAQEVDTAWVRRYNGPGNAEDSACAIAIDNSGNVYVTGASYGWGTGEDYATIKYYPDGDTAWVRRYNGTGDLTDEAFDIAVDGFGDVCVTGWSFDSETSLDYTTIKYYSNGDTAWVRRYNGTGNSWDKPSAVAIDGSGNVYVTGVSVGSGTNADFVTVKYDKNGNELWVMRYNGPGDSIDMAQSIALDGSGNVYVTGTSISSKTYFDFATIKYDKNGKEVWGRRYNGPGNSEDAPCSIVIDGFGSIYVAGWSTGYGTDYDYATIRYDQNGNELWVKRYNGSSNGRDTPCGMAVDGSGNIYVTGWSYDSLTYIDYATIKYDQNGNELWIGRYNGLENDWDQACAIAVDGAGDVFVTGHSWCGLETYRDYATVKYDPDGKIAWVRTYNGISSKLDWAYAIAIDVFGNVYVTGKSDSSGKYPADYTTIKYAPISHDLNKKR